MLLAFEHSNLEIYILFENKLVIYLENDFTVKNATLYLRDTAINSVVRVGNYTLLRMFCT